MPKLKLWIDTVEVEDDDENHIDYELLMPIKLGEFDSVDELISALFGFMLPTNGMIQTNEETEKIAAGLREFLKEKGLIDEV